MSWGGCTVTDMSKHLAEIEAVPTGTTYGPVFPLMYILALLIVETFATLDRGCWVLGFCG